MNKHQRTAVYCLSLQGKEKQDIHCEYCSKVFSRTDFLTRHQKTCIFKPHQQDVVTATPATTSVNTTDADANADADAVDSEEELLPVDPDLLAVFVKLKEVMESLSGIFKPRLTEAERHVTVQNLTPLTDADLTQHLDKLSLEYIEQGGKGYATYASCHSLTGKVVCTDQSRKKLKYKNDEGLIISDAYGTKLTKRFFQAIAPRNEELIKGEYADLLTQVESIAVNGLAGTSNLTTILGRATKLQSVLAKCKEAAKGQENDMTREFINHLCRNL